MADHGHAAGRRASRRAGAHLPGVVRAAGRTHDVAARGPRAARSPHVRTDAASSGTGVSRPRIAAALLLWLVLATAPADAPAQGDSLAPEALGPPSPDEPPPRLRLSPREAKRIADGLPEVR